MYWKNSNFQIKHFIAGRCHTADEAYRQLKQLLDDRFLAVKNTEAAELRNAAKRKRAEQVIENSKDEADVLEARADLAELATFEDQNRESLEQAKRECEYIQSLMDEIEPHRKYRDLPDHEAFQKTQEEEWLLELMWRAENYLGSQGFIPHDHIATMRMHPMWTTTLLPHVEKVMEHLKKQQNVLTYHAPPALEVDPSSK